MRYLTSKKLKERSKYNFMIWMPRISSLFTRISKYIFAYINLLNRNVIYIYETIRVTLFPLKVRASSIFSPQSLSWADPLSFLWFSTILHQLYCSFFSFFDSINLCLFAWLFRVVWADKTHRETASRLLLSSTQSFIYFSQLI